VYALLADILAALAKPSMAGRNHRQLEESGGEPPWPVLCLSAFRKALSVQLGTIPRVLESPFTASMASASPSPIRLTRSSFSLWRPPSQTLPAVMQGSPWY
jgi:hypothetical protein